MQAKFTIKITHVIKSTPVVLQKAKYFCCSLHPAINITLDVIKTCKINILLHTMQEKFTIKITHLIKSTPVVCNKQSTSVVHCILQ